LGLHFKTGKWDNSKSFVITNIIQKMHLAYCSINIFGIHFSDEKIGQAHGAVLSEYKSGITLQ
jgi:hypothetical protein